MSTDEETLEYRLLKVEKEMQSWRLKFEKEALWRKHLEDWILKTFRYDIHSQIEMECSKVSLKVNETEVEIPIRFENELPGSPCDLVDHEVQLTTSSVPHFEPISKTIDEVANNSFSTQLQTAKSHQDEITIGHEEKIASDHINPELVVSPDVQLHVHVSNSALQHPHLQSHTHTSLVANSFGNRSAPIKMENSFLPELNGYGPNNFHVGGYEETCGTVELPNRTDQNDTSDIDMGEAYVKSENVNGPTGITDSKSGIFHSGFILKLEKRNSRTLLSGTDAEYKRRYRARLSEEKKAQIRERDRERHRAYRAADRTRIIS